MARAGKQHIVRIRESIYSDIRRKKEAEGRVEGVNQYIENILSAYVKGALKTPKAQSASVEWSGTAETSESKTVGARPKKPPQKDQRVQNE